MTKVCRLLSTPKPERPASANYIEENRWLEHGTNSTPILLHRCRPNDLQQAGQCRRRECVRYGR